MGVLNTVRSGLNVLFTPVLYGVVASLALQLSTWEKGDRTQDKLQDTNNPDILKAQVDTFDFIVVGGGTAGSVVANRLSEFYSVLVLEAGGEPNPLVYVPGLARNLVNRQEVDWQHKTVAQRKACLLGQFKRASWSQGKGLGGSGNLGWMISLRGHQKDFDNWGKLVGDEGWEYERLRKYFKRHENFVGNTTDSEAHIQGGELTIQLPDYRPLASEFVWAGKELGYPNLDLNGRFTEGFDEIYYPTKKGEKLTTYKSFLEPIKRRENLTIRKFATVTKILLRKGDNSAYGLEYERHGKKYTVYVTREVILSAGTVQSAKLLLHSGIGPKRHLEDLGIKPLVNLPVGRNLQDHLAVFLGPFFIKDPLSFDFDRDVTAKSFFEYGTFGTGPVTTTGFTATAFLASSFAKLRGEKEWPDYQLLMHAVSVHSNYASDMAHAYGINEEPLKKYYKHALGRHSFHIAISLSRPYARGEIRLASKNPTNPVIIDPKYFEDPWDFDVKTMVEGVKKAIELVEGTTKFQGMGGHFTSEPLPGCEKQKFRSDDYFECYIRQLTVSMQDPVGTCTMGPVGSIHTVVDSQLRVVNVPGLRVVDAGVMPSIVVGGTQQAVMAIAEKGAENVLEYWKNKRGGGQSISPNTIISQPPKFLKEEISNSSPEKNTQLISSSEVVSVKSNVKSIFPTFQSIVQSSTPKPLNFLDAFTSANPVTSKPFNFMDAFTSNPTTPRANSFLDAFTLNPETSQNWQNTLDQLSQFSKQIQQTLQQVAPSPSPSTTTTTVRTTTTSKPTQRPHIVYYQSPTPPKKPTPSYRPVTPTPTIGVTFRTPEIMQSTSTTRTTTPFVYVPLINLPPTQQVKITPHSSPTPKVTTYKPPLSHTPSPTAPRATTFRPPDHHNFNSTMFSVNVPIIKANYKSVSLSQSGNVIKPYPTSTSAPRKSVQNNSRKEHQYQKFLPPKQSTPSYIPSSTPPPPPPTTTTTRPPTTTTTRRTMFEMIHSQVLPHGYSNYVEIPLTAMDYQVVHPQPSSPPPTTTRYTTTTTTPTTTTTTTRATTRKSYNAPSASNIQIVPAVHLTKEALETTTTRYTVPAKYRNFGLTQVQSIPQDVFLTGLEPYNLIDVTTARESPTPSTTTVASVQLPQIQHHSQNYNNNHNQNHHQHHHHQKLKQQQQQQQRQQNLQTTSEKAPLFYVVRKKTVQPKNIDQFTDYTDSIKLTAPPRQNLPRRPQRPQRPFHQRKPNQQRRPPPPQSRQHGRHHPSMSTAQSQQNYPMIALPPSNYGQPQRQQIQHFLTTVQGVNDHLGMGSQNIHTILPPPPQYQHQQQSQQQQSQRSVTNGHSGTRSSSSSADNSDDSLDGIITPAITSQFFQQDILDQLIPIQK